MLLSATTRHLSNHQSSAVDMQTDCAHLISVRYTHTHPIANSATVHEILWYLLTLRVVRRNLCAWRLGSDYARRRRYGTTTSIKHTWNCALAGWPVRTAKTIIDIIAMRGSCPSSCCVLCCVVLWALCVCQSANMLRWIINVTAQRYTHADGHGAYNWNTCSRRWAGRELNWNLRIFSIFLRFRISLL